MKDTEIRRYAELMKELGLTGLEMTEGDSKVRLERSVPVPAGKSTLCRKPHPPCGLRRRTGIISA